MKRILALTGLIILTVVLLVRSGRHNTIVETTASTNPPAPVASATENGQRLTLGIRPTFNPNQQFSPPTNSVVITNEAQLRDLIAKRQIEMAQKPVGER